VIFRHRDSSLVEPHQKEQEEEEEEHSNDSTGCEVYILPETSDLLT
jgi:hypothetical protein